MPWKGEKNPYKIWLSEIILQQTRVEQGRAYYERFIKAFPTVYLLAAAPEKKVFKYWEGLGYYNRCKNLIETAKIITRVYGGKFPSSYPDIIGLKGIGPYTAAAIASFAFNLPYAVVDGNVERVIARYFGITTPVDTAAGKKFYTELANVLLDKKQAGIYNQSIMDFGATVCKPKNPLCLSCVQNHECQAHLTGKVSMLPLKKKSVEKKTRWLYYFIIGFKDKVYIKQRLEDDIWKNLYEFVLFESDKPMKQEALTESGFFKRLSGKTRFLIRSYSEIYKQELTHQTVYGQFIQMEVFAALPLLKQHKLIKKIDLGQFPFPGFMASFLRQNGHERG